MQDPPELREVELTPVMKILGFQQPAQISQRLQVGS